MRSARCFQRACLGWAAVLVLVVFAGGGQAALEFSRATVELGEVRCGAPLGHRFLFVNRGNTTAEIVAVKTACGCMTPIVSKKVVGPGEEGEIQLEVNTLSQAAGPQDWWVRLQWRADGQVQDTTLHLVGRLIAEIGVEPASLVIQADREIQHTLTLTDTRPQPLAVQGVSATSKCLETAVGQPARNKDGQWTIPIRLHYTGNVADGTYQETISICTSDPAYPELRVPVTLIKETDHTVTAAPGFVSIHVPPGQAIPSKMIVIRNSGDEPVDIESVTAGDPALRCTWAPGPENHATIKLTIDRQQLKGDHLLDALRIQIRKPTVQTLTVPVECALE